MFTWPTSPLPNQKATSYAPASRLSAGLVQMLWAQGSNALENPQGITGWYGYQNDAPSPDNPNRPQMVVVPPNSTAEAQETEPDKNTYLRFKYGASGPDQNYYYGSRFVYQGHELAAPDANKNAQGYLTRINLDADAQHRVTLMATHDDHGQLLSTIDGSTWDPWAQRLILTTENQNAPTYAATATYPSTVQDVSGALGRGGCEGVQNDSAGNLWIVEDISGPQKQGAPARRSHDDTAPRRSHPAIRSRIRS